MLKDQKIVVVLPAYNAELTLRRTVSELDCSLVDTVVLVDDASRDNTIAVAKELGLEIRRHTTNRGYGGNQKTCYQTALELGADIIVMVHPDYQYSPLLVPAMAAMIAYGQYDMVLGSRILAQSPTQGGMPLYKYVANRALTFAENVLVSQKLSEYHTGLRAYRRELLEALPVEHDSEDFIFDNQVIVQAIAAGARIGEISCPTRYNADASNISFKRSTKYGLGVLATAATYRFARSGLVKPPQFLRAVNKLSTTSEIGAAAKA